MAQMRVGSSIGAGVGAGLSELGRQIAEMNRQKQESALIQQRQVEMNGLNEHNTLTNLLAQNPELAQRLAQNGQSPAGVDPSVFLPTAQESIKPLQNEIIKARKPDDLLPDASVPDAIRAAVGYNPRRPDFANAPSAGAAFMDQSAPKPDFTDPSLAPAPEMDQMLRMNSQKRGQINDEDVQTKKDAVDQAGKISEATTTGHNKAEALNFPIKLKQDLATERQKSNIAIDQAKAIYNAGPGKDARLDRSYKDNATILENIRKPIMAKQDKIATALESLSKGDPTADSVVVQELLSGLTAGTGSGIRINNAEITRVFGSASKFEQFKQVIAHATPGSNYIIPPKQRQEMTALLATAQDREAAKLDRTLQALNDLSRTTDVVTHRQITHDAERDTTLIDLGKYHDPNAVEPQEPADPRLNTAKSKLDALRQQNAR